jgi:hypothetical protein
MKVGSPKAHPRLSVAAHAAIKGALNRPKQQKQEQAVTTPEHRRSKSEQDKSL